MYFLGVTTGASSIHRIFPRWAELAGVGGAVLHGVDLAVEATAASYRRAVENLRDDAEAWGALVTTHKVGLYAHARDLFAGLDPEAERLGEVGCIVKRGGRLTGQAVDTVTAGLALSAIGPFRGRALIMGAGGAGVALATHLPGVTLTDISAERLEQARSRTAAECRLVRSAEDHDRLIQSLPAGSLIVNATGMGKDRPGAPVNAAVRFPAHSIAWDFNYRGKLLMLDYARAQGIRAVDGWQYFLHGWSQIMARVFGFELTNPLFTAMRAAAGN